MIVYNKGGTDKTIIMAVREALVQRFTATDWQDIRIGFLLSITAAGADDTITGLGETLTAAPGLSTWDRYYIGVIDKATTGTFIGYTNRAPGRGNTTLGNSVLGTSDGAVGTTNANFWRPYNSLQNSWSAQIMEAFLGQQETRAESTDNVQQHFVQNAGGAGGYATLLEIRLQRPDPLSHLITATVKQGTKSTDVLYTNDPSYATLLTNLQAFPGTVQTWGPVELQNIPDSFFLYWPWHNSRLRIHCMGLVKVAT
jgi:hypothetical protein